MYVLDSPSLSWQVLHFALDVLGDSCTQSILKQGLDLLPLKLATASDPIGFLPAGMERLNNSRNPPPLETV